MRIKISPTQGTGEHKLDQNIFEMLEVLIPTVVEVLEGSMKPVQEIQYGPAEDNPSNTLAFKLIMNDSIGGNLVSGASFEQSFTVSLCDEEKVAEKIALAVKVNATKALYDRQEYLRIGIVDSLDPVDKKNWADRREDIFAAIMEIGKIKVHDICSN